MRISVSAAGTPWLTDSVRLVMAVCLGCDRVRGRRRSCAVDSPDGLDLDVLLQFEQGGAPLASAVSE